MASSETHSLPLQEDYRVAVEGCALVDRSERGKLALTGGGAVEFLNGQVTNELANLHPGEGRYAAFLTHKGKMLGDLRILAVGGGSASGPSDGNFASGSSDGNSGNDGNSASSSGSESASGSNGSSPLARGSMELLLDTERVALQALFDMIRRFKVGYDVELHKRTLEQALLSLIGPSSREVAAQATAADGALPLPDSEHAHVPARIAGRGVRLVSTEAAGVDVLCDADDREAVGGALESAGAVAVGERTAEIVRVERGRPRYGVDIDDTTIPQEAGLNERAVSFTKGCYVGQETVARLYYRGKPNRHLRGLRLTGEIATGAELRLGERSVGHLGSAVLSPALGPIALALVRREAEPGATVSVGEQGVEGEVVALPFRDSG